MPDPLAEIRRLMLLNVNDRHQAATRWPPGQVTFKPHVYRGAGHDIMECRCHADDPRVARMVAAALEAEGFRA